MTDAHTHTGDFTPGAENPRRARDEKEAGFEAKKGCGPALGETRQL